MAGAYLQSIKDKRSSCFQWCILGKGNLGNKVKIEFKKFSEFTCLPLIFLGFAHETVNHVFIDS